MIQQQYAALANAMIAVAAFFTFSWNPLVEGAGQFLIDPDAPCKSDIIFLLGGDYMARSPLAAALLKSGYGRAIVIAREPNGFTEKTIDYLVALGVERSKTFEIRPPSGVHSTADEARAFRGYVNSHTVKSVLVVTSVMHSRRAKMAIQRALWGTGVGVRVVCVGNPVYGPAEQPAAKLEWTKLIYYFFTFFG